MDSAALTSALFSLLLAFACHRMTGPSLPAHVGFLFWKHLGIWGSNGLGETLRKCVTNRQCISPFFDMILSLSVSLSLSLSLSISFISYLFIFHIIYWFYHRNGIFWTPASQAFLIFAAFSLPFPALGTIAGALPQSFEDIPIDNLGLLLDNMITW